MPIIDGVQAYEQSGVFAYLSGSAITTVVTSGSYTPIAGAFVNNPVLGFDVIPLPAIQYKGATTRNFLVVWSCTLSSDSPGTTVHVAIRNGGAEIASIMGNYLKTAGEIYTCSGNVVHTLQAEETIQLAVTADSDDTDITFYHFTTAITPFGC